MKKSLVLLFPILQIYGLYCPFCDPDILSKQTVISGDKASAILTHKPAVQGHMLIIPNRHVERFEDLSSEELLEMDSLIIQVNSMEQKIFGNEGYLLLQKNGKEAGQSVPHVHIHYYPRKQQESHFWFALRLLFAHWQPALSAEQMETAKEIFRKPE